jgi:cytochrome c5
MRRLLIIILFVNTATNWAASHHPQDFLNTISGSPNEGEQIVQHYCSNCHAKKPLIPLGAPRIGLASDWELRRKQGVDLLFKHTDEGLNAMPARGGCFECSDKQLMLAIVAMLPKKVVGTTAKKTK